MVREKAGQGRESSTNIGGLFLMQRQPVHILQFNANLNLKLAATRKSGGKIGLIWRKTCLQKTCVKHFVPASVSNIPLPVYERTADFEMDMCQRWDMCSLSRRPFAGAWQLASNKVSISEHLQFESLGIANNVSPIVVDTSVASRGRAGTTSKSNPDHTDAEHKPRSGQSEINSID